MAAETEIEKLIVRLAGDSSQYAKMLKDATEITKKASKEIEDRLYEVLKELQEEERKAAQAAKEQAEAARKAAEEEAKRAAVMKRGADVMRSVENATERYARETKELDQLLKEGAIDQETYNRALQVSASSTDEYRAAIDRAEREQADMNRLMDRGASITKEVENASEKYAAEVKELKSLLASGAISQEAYNRALGRADDAMRQANAGIKVFGTGLDNVGRMAKSAGTNLSLYVTAPLVALAGASAKTAVDFETAMSQIEGLAGIPADEIEGLSQRIKDIAPSLGQTPAELAKGFQTIAGAGFEANEAFEIMVVSARAAAAGLGETTVVADAVTSAMGSYGSDVLSAADATDILTAAVIEGKAEANTFAPVLGQVLPLAAELGVTFEEAAGSMAFLTKSTGSASISATGLRGILTQLIRPTSQAKDAFAAAGTSIDEIRKTIRERGMLVALMELRTSLEESGQEMSTVFADVEGLNAVLQMTGTEADKAAESITNVGNYVGVTGEAFATAADTAGFRWKQASAAISVAMIDLGNIVGPILQNVAQAISWAAARFSELSDSSKNALTIIGTAAAVVGPALVVFGTMAQSVNAIHTALVLMGPQMAAANITLTAFGVQMNTAALGAIALKAALVGGAVIGIGILATTIYNMMPSIQMLNDELERGAVLSGKLNKEWQNNARETLRAARMLPAGERVAFLEEKAAEVQQNIRGKIESAKAAEKRVEDSKFGSPRTVRFDDPSVGADFKERIREQARRGIVDITSMDGESVTYRRPKSAAALQFGSAQREVDEAEAKELREQAEVLQQTLDQYKNAIAAEKEMAAVKAQMDAQIEAAVKGITNTAPTAPPVEAGKPSVGPVEAPKPGGPVEAPKPGRNRVATPVAGGAILGASNATLQRIARAVERLVELEENKDSVDVEPAGIR